MQMTYESMMTFAEEREDLTLSGCFPVCCDWSALVSAL
jgi:hypothetical protein